MTENTPDDTYHSWCMNLILPVQTQGWYRGLSGVPSERHTRRISAGSARTHRHKHIVCKNRLVSTRYPLLKPSNTERTGRGCVTGQLCQQETLSNKSKYLSLFSNKAPVFNIRWPCSKSLMTSLATSGPFYIELCLHMLILTQALSNKGLFLFSTVSMISN